MQAHPRPRALRAPWLRGGRALRAGCRRVPARGFAPARPKTRGAAATGRAVGLIRQGRARPHLAASFRRGAGLLRSARGALEPSPRRDPRPLRARRPLSGPPGRPRPGGGRGGEGQPPRSPGRPVEVRRLGAPQAAPGPGGAAPAQAAPVSSAGVTGRPRPMPHARRPLRRGPPPIPLFGPRPRGGRAGPPGPADAATGHPAASLRPAPRFRFTTAPPPP